MTRTAPTQREGSIRVLHVDDEANQLEFAKTFIVFSDPAIHMESSPTPKEALDRLRDESFDCIVSDYQMPGMDGIELARRIRETSDVPIIIYTGRGSEEVAEAAFTVGIDDYIRKEMNPSHYQVLAKRIRTAVEKKRAEDKETRERDKAQNYFDIAGVILVVLDAEGKISLLNQKGAQVLGISPEEAQGKDWYGSFLPARKGGDVRQIFKELMKGNLELVESVENSVVTTSGEERIIAWKNTVLRDDEDNIIGTLSSGEDITERKRAELALEESEKKFRVLTEKSVAGIYIIQDSMMAYVNPSLAKTFGYSTDEIIGILSPQDLIHPDDLERVMRRLTERLDGEIPSRNTELRAKRKDGSLLFIETYGVLIEYQGRPAVMGTIIDVTERMRMETELRESEEKYRKVMESSMEAITIVSDGIIVYANQRFVDFLGYDELSEVLGKESAEFVPPEERELLTGKRKQRNAGDSIPFRYECRYLRKDGSTISGEVQTTIMEYEGKRATLGFVRDYTERKRIEEEIQDSEALYRELTENSLDIIYRVDLEGYITYVSPAVEAITGYDPEELIGESFYKLVPEEKRHEIGSTILDAVGGGEHIQRFQTEILRKDGARLTVETNTSRIFERGNMVGFQGIIRDITKREQIKEESGRYLERIETLHRHATKLGLADTFDGILDESLEVIHQMIGFEWSCFGIVEGDSLSLRYRKRLNIESTGSLPLDGRGITVRCVNSGETQNIGDVREDPDYIVGPAALTRKFLSELDVPVKIDGEVFAVLNIESEELDAFTEQDKKLAETLAIHVASAIERLRRLDIERDAQEKYRNLLESSSDAVIVITDGKYRYVNQRTVELLGYDSPQELMSHDVFEDIAPKDRERISRMLGGRLRGEEYPVQYELRLLRKDGTEVEVENHVSIIDFEGKPASLAFTRDITERKRMEKTLVALHRHATEFEKCKNEEEVHAVALSAMEHTLGFDRVDVLMVEGDMLKQVAAHESLPRGLELPLDGKGLTVKAIRERKSVLVNDVGANEDYIFIADPSGEHLRTRSELLEDYPSSKSELAVPIIVDDEAVGVLNVESLRRTAFVEQDRILLEILANHVASVIGRIRKVSELGKAIEDRELAERELLEYTETLSEAVEEKTREVLDLERMSAAGKVAAMVGHDLRGPLQTIKNALYLMERNPEEGAEFRKVVDEAVNYAASMLEELRLNVGDTPLQLQEVNLGALIRRVVDEASIPDSVEAEVHVDDGLGSVSMDPLKIRRVLDNLVRNAVEAMPDGGTLGVSTVCDGDVVFVRVRDTGTGIPEELMPELFKAFVTTKPQGMGLGLAYCKRAVEAHGGTIVAQSKIGEGTTIIFEIPTETS